ncbi:hypothetical protein Aperf_G00000034307 [Anoplocephala perfoliata]
MDNGQLKDNLVLNVDVISINKHLFEELAKLYGANCDKKMIPYRNIYKTEKNGFTFDLYPPSICLIPRGEYARFNIKCCSNETLGYVKTRIRDRNCLGDNAEIHLWDAKNRDELTEDENTTLKECSLVGDKEIEYSVGSKSSPNGDGNGCMYINRFPSFPLGVCGLSNLGNTCFMNSAIQCISNVAPLREFVLSPDFESNINETNKLGSHGEIAHAFAGLIREMWSDKKRGSSCVPRELKIRIARYAPQFTGYCQHDAQELMNFLLDFLNEDLNRIKEKPYIEDKDANGRSDVELANEAWDNFKRRNDSIIVDLFYGLLKSTVECPKCGYISVTFDPFSSLSLPLDIKYLSIHYGPFMNYSLPVPPSCMAADVVQSLQHHKTLENGSRYVVTRLNGDELNVIPHGSNEPMALYSGNIYVFKVSGDFVLKVVLLVNGGMHVVPLLVSFYNNPNRISKHDLCGAIKSELSKYGEEYGEVFYEAYKANKLKFTFENEMLSADPETAIVVEFIGEMSIEKNTPTKLPVKLHNCMDLFLSSEQLGERDLWYCKKCKEHQRAFKKFDLWKLPKVLVIHLKRYKSHYRVMKNELFVDYPLDNFKLTYLHDSPTYELVAVSNHMGGLGGGHYTAYAKNGNTWYSFNDTYVDKLDVSPITSSAYILVYTSKETILNGY